jgi:hypothetical protein
LDEEHARKISSFFCEEKQIPTLIVAKNILDMVTNQGVEINLISLTFWEEL